MRRCPQGMPMAENPENKQRWYALRVTYGREMLVKGYLDGIGVESYIPMHFARRTYGERTRKVWEPLIHNLLFICTSAVRLKEIKACTTLRAAEVYRKNKSADPSSHTYAICATLIRKLTPLNFRL